MKRRFFAFIICVLMTAASLYGCASPAASGPQVAKAADPAATEAPLQTPAPAEAAGGKSPKEWIASDVMGNVTADTQVELRDDFHAAVNKDWMATAQIPEGQNETMPAVDRSMEIQEQMRALLTDETKSGHEAELLRTLYGQYTDMDTRNALGTAPLQAYIEEIQALQA